MLLPSVVVVIPCRNEINHIEACLDDVFAQDYPAELLRVIVADGMSSDGTRTRLDELALRWPGRLTVIDNLRRRQAAALAEMIDTVVADPADSATVIMRMDVHARYACDYVMQCVLVLAETGADNVGGTATARATNRFQKILVLALRSPLAIGGAKYRTAGHDGYVDTIFPGAFRRDVFSRIGSFDPDAITNEDAEFNQRIVAAGGRIFQSPRIVLQYVPRGSLRGLAGQYFTYGQGRARTLAKHGRLLNIRPVLPGLLVGVLGTTVMTQRLHRRTAKAVGGYLFACLAEAVRVGWATPESDPSQPGIEGVRAVPEPGRAERVAGIAVIFPVLHLCHGVGLWHGLWRHRRLLAETLR